jgi:short-subunit dehydrogenase
MGARLIITGRDQTRLKSTFIDLAGKDHIQIKADLTATEELLALIEQIPSIRSLQG